MDSRPAAGDNGGAPRQPAQPSADLPEYEFHGDADEEVPF